MEKLTPEADFRRYRDHTDVEAMARVFDAVAPRLLLVAAHFARDAAEAEDLVQTTLVQAMERPKQYEPGRPLLPWLLGILVHRAKDQLRRARVRRAEPLEDAPSSIDVEALVESAELRERTAHAVDTLDDPYREVVLLRLLHGLTPTEIAHTLGRAPGTVRVQLQRGLERLRRALPRGVALPAFLIAESGRGWDAVRGEVLAQASGATQTAPVTQAPTLKSTIPIAPVAPVAWKAGVVLLIAGIGGLILSVAARNDRSIAPSRRTDHELRALRTAEPSFGTATEAASKRVIRADGQASDSSGSSLRVSVVDSAGVALADVGVRLHPLDHVALPVEARTNESGEAILVASAGRYRLLVDRYIAWSREVVVEETSTCGVTLPDGVSVDGVVLDRDGAGVAGARVFALRHGEHDRAMLLARTDQAGAFHVGRFVNDETRLPSVLFARADGYQPSSTARKSTRLGISEPKGIRLTLGPRAAHLAGRVIDAAGAPVPHARVVAFVDEDARDGGRSAPAGSDRPIDSDAILLRANEDGAFDSHELPPGDVSLMVHALNPSDERIGRARIRLSRERDATCEVVLEPAARVFGQITDEIGTPLEGARVRLEWQGNLFLGDPEDALGEDLAVREATTLSDGSYLLVGIPSGQSDLHVFPPRSTRTSDRERFELARGESRRIDLSIEISRGHTLRLFGPSGEPLVDWVVAWGRSIERTDGGGRCAFEDLRKSDSWVEIYPPTDVSSLERNALRKLVLPSRRMDARPGENELDIALTLDEMPTAAIRGDLNDETGRPFPTARLRLLPGGLGEELPLDVTDGRFEARAIPSGDYVLKLYQRGYGRDLFGPFTVQANERLDVGVLAARRSASIDVTVRVSDGREIKRPEVTLLPERFHREDGDPIFSPYVEQLHRNRGSDRSTYGDASVAPGDYVLSVSGRDIVAHTERIHVEPGQKFETTVEVNRGRTQTFVVRVDPDPLAKRRDDSSLKVGVTIHTDAGRHVLWFREGTEEHQGDPLVGTFDVPLAPGRYVARIEDHRRGSWSGAFAEVAFDVPASGSLAPIDVYVPMP